MLPNPKRDMENGFGVGSCSTNILGLFGGRTNECVWQLQRPIRAAFCLYTLLSACMCVGAMPIASLNFYAELTMSCDGTGTACYTRNGAVISNILNWNMRMRRIIEKSRKKNTKIKVP